MRKLSCYCSVLHRLKHRGVRCTVCRTECSFNASLDESVSWLNSDYKDMNRGCAIRLTAHTLRLAYDVKSWRIVE